MANDAFMKKKWVALLSIITLMNGSLVTFQMLSSGCTGAISGKRSTHLIGIARSFSSCCKKRVKSTIFSRYWRRIGSAALFLRRSLSASSAWAISEVFIESSINNHSNFYNKRIQGTTVCHTCQPPHHSHLVSPLYFYVSVNKANTYII